MPKRVAEDEEWEARKDEIVKLYKHENKPLPQVMALMASRAGFKRTKAQYERYLKKWAIKKNSKAAEWKLIARRYHEREAQRRLTSVEIRGVVFPPAKVRKEVARYGYQTTMERFTSGLPSRRRSETPPGIRLFTPPGSLSPLDSEPMELIPALSLSNPEMNTSWTDEAFFHLADCTPWRPFMRFIHSLDTTGPSQLLSLPGTALTNTTPALPYSAGANKEFEVISGMENSLLTKWLNNILCAIYVPDLVEYFFPIQCIKPGPYLPPKDGPPDVDMNAIMDLSTKSTQLEFLKHAVNLVSNNFDVGRVSSVIVELAHDKHNQSLLRSLFDQNLLIADAFAEKLFIPAVRGKNVPLIKILLEAGCDINMRQFDIVAGMSALQCAVEQDDEKFVSFLLDNGANSDVRDTTHRLPSNASRFSFDSLLDFAVSERSLSIVKELLKPRPTFQHEMPEISIDTLCFAVLRGDIEMFQFLIDNDPQLYDLIHLESGILLEAAASHNGTSTFSAIERYVPNFNKTNESDKGSPLAVAAASNNMALVCSLAATSANLRRTLMGTRYPIANLRGLAALHVAVWKENEDIAQFLISKGADVDQCCYTDDGPVFPIQLATYRENEVLVNMLLDAGAGPNNVAGEAFPVNLVHFPHHPRDVSGRPALRIALEMGNATLFDQLLQRGAIMPTSSTHVNGWDPLICAMRGGNIQLIKRIFQEFGIVDRAMHEYLAKCISYCGHDMADELTELCSIQPEDIYHPEVLCAAVVRGNMDFVQRLLTDAKASLGKLPPHYGATGFASAARKGKFDMIPIFLSAGIKPYQTALMLDISVDPLPNYLTSALVEALRGSHRPTPEPLGLLINACDKPVTGSYEHYLWQSTLFAAATLAIGRFPEFVSLIIAKGIDINWTIQGYGTLLQTCLRCNYVNNVTAYPVHVGANPDISVNGHTMFQDASKKAPSSLFELLLCHGADVFAPPRFNHGATALQYAAMHGNFEILNMLMKEGVSINEPAGKFEGRTAIEGAAEHGRLNMVSYLLEAGANVRGRTNQNYRRTIYRAWNQGHRTLVRMIQDWKRERYGVDDCEDTEVILESMTKDELDYESPAAKLEYEKWRVEANRHPMWFVLY